MNDRDNKVHDETPTTTLKSHQDLALNKTLNDTLKDRFFEVSIDLLCYLRFDGYFQNLNPAWVRTLGFSIAELKAKPFIEFVHPDDREATLNQNRRVRAGQQALAFENRYLCKDGSFRWLLWNAAADYHHDVIFSVARDITARKATEQENEKLLGELRAALADVKTLKEIIPICSYCRQVRDDENYWQTVETYVAMQTKSKFSHGICPSCFSEHVKPALDERKQKKARQKEVQKKKN